MDKSAARKNGQGGVIICSAPDVCKTPVGNSVVPIPYMITSMLSFTKREASSVEFGGLKAFNMNSRTDKVIGDEPGTLGGVKSGVNRGWCKPITNHPTVMVEDHNLVLNDCMYDMNCAGPEGSGNTVGRLMYFCF